MAQSVEHVIGNDEVISSILITSSKNPTRKSWIFLFGIQINPWFYQGSGKRAER